MVSISSFASAISGLVDASKHTLTAHSATDVIVPGDPARMAGCFLLTVCTLLLLFETGAPYKFGGRETLPGDSSKKHFQNISQPTPNVKDLGLPLHSLPTDGFWQSGATEPLLLLSHLNQGPWTLENSRDLMPHLAGM